MNKIQITITDILLHYEDPLVVTAADNAGATFLGISFDDADSEGRLHFAFAQVDRPTMLEVVRGQRDMRSALNLCQAGKALVAVAFGAPGEEVSACIVDAIDEKVLPAPEMFLPCEAVVPLAA